MLRKSLSRDLVTGEENRPLLRPDEVQQGGVSPVRVEDLWDYIRQAKQTDMEGLKSEYKVTYRTD